MLITALVFLILLSILVLVHEIGHFVAAKKLGIKVEEFGFGLPPRMFGFKKGETVYSINWLPIGGFVKLYGEEGEDDIEASKVKTPVGPQDLKRAFYNRPVWQRSVVLIAGVSMNFLLALFVISFLFTQGVMVPTDRVHIEKLVQGSPADDVGLKIKDTIKKFRVKNQKGIVEEIEIKSGEKLIKTTKDHLGEDVELLISRSAKEGSCTSALRACTLVDGTIEFVVNLKPRKDYPKDQGPMGVVISTYEEKKYPFWQAPYLGLKESVNLSYQLVKGIAITVWKLISFQPVAKDVAGPIGIAQMTGEAIKFGESAVLELLGLLSLNLAIVNILPFPALDGGRLLFVLIEGITGKRIRTHWERYVHQAGMIILITLMVLVTLNDLVRIFVK